MSAYFEIAYATASNRLCLFTGTGFSKAVTENKAPSWQELLEKCCDLLPNSSEIKNGLFPKDKQNPLSLEESAQVIDIELGKIEKKIHSEIVKYIKTIKLSGSNSNIKDFFEENPLVIFTTNYDKLAEKLALSKKCHTMAPGLAVARSSAHTKVYHVHGSVDSPYHMVVTSEDYFQFINTESYFSRKLSTALYENTVVILGYSLGDTNLKAIMSDYKGFSSKAATGGNIFFVARGKIDQHVKDYYNYCYGIRVIDNTSVHEFFKRVSTCMSDAKKCAERTTIDLEKVLYKNHEFQDEYLKMELSMFEIVSSVSAVGRSVNDPQVVKLIVAIIKRKMIFTRDSGAWEQYEHLARWLVYLASIINLGAADLKEVYLDAALHSMNTMSKTLTLGYSWHAYAAWANGWFEINAKNRQIIKEYITKKCTQPEALELVKCL